ncbi:MAG: acyl-ACP--UDP-N-acetylglucosamine O-acyltransferase [Phycisphaerae bacterium]
MPIHPTAIVERSAEIDPTADIGPYAVVETGVKIGAACKLWHHAFVATGTTLGERVQIHPFAVVGHPPQDLAWKGEPSYTRIGDDTIIREHATVHRGTMPESVTTVGKKCFLMSTAHVGHNCTVDDEVIFANAAILGGHVRVGRKAFISAAAIVHQFCRIGEFAMLGGVTRIPTDVPPFAMVMPGGVVGLNVVGLRRNGFSPAERAELRVIYKMIYRSKRSTRDAIADAAKLVQTPAGKRFVEFLQEPAKRPLMRYYGGRDGAPIDAD